MKAAALIAEWPFWQIFVANAVGHATVYGAFGLLSDGLRGLVASAAIGVCVTLAAWTLIWLVVALAQQFMP